MYVCKKVYIRKYVDIWVTSSRLPDINSFPLRMFAHLLQCKIMLALKYLWLTL